MGNLRGKLQVQGMIVALAGRRIDAEGAAVPRFPLERVDAVRKRIRIRLSEMRATVLISSGACGADLIAQEVAGELGIQRRVVLPFDRERFRALSVTDRPGNWGPRYDTICDEVAAAGGLTVLSYDPREEISFKYAGDDILALVLRWAGTQGGGLVDQAAVILVWDRVARSPDDITAQFGNTARAQGLRVIQISTLPRR